MSITLFYGNQVCGTYPNTSDMYLDYGMDSDIYQGGIVYWPKRDRLTGDSPWYSMDLCPIIPTDVPKETRLLAIILNL